MLHAFDEGAIGQSFVSQLHTSASQPNEPTDVQYMQGEAYAPADESEGDFTYQQYLGPEHLERRTEFDDYHSEAEEPPFSQAAPSAPTRSQILIELQKELCYGNRHQDQDGEDITQFDDPEEEKSPFAYAPPPTERWPDPISTARSRNARQSGANKLELGRIADQPADCFTTLWVPKVDRIRARGASGADLAPHASSGSVSRLALAEHTNRQSARESDDVLFSRQGAVAPELGKGFRFKGTSFRAVPLQGAAGNPFARAAGHLRDNRRPSGPTFSSPLAKNRNERPSMPTSRPFTHQKRRFFEPSAL